MLTNYISEPIRKITRGFKYKVVSSFRSNTPNRNMYGRGKELSKPKTQKQSEENKINRVGNHFIVKKKKETKKRNYRWNN